MFEPEELMARIVDLEEQLKVSEMAPPAAEQLIACLEGEIAKRDEELAACRVAVENCELFRARIAELEHRCGMYGLELTNEVERRLQAERQLSALKAQELAESDYYRSMLRAVLKDIRDEIPRGGLPQSWNDIADSISASLHRPLYAAPVSVAKAQGVVLTDEELCSIRNQVACNEVRRDDDSRTICVKHGRALEAAVLARLNAAPAAPAAAAGHVFYGMDGNHP